MNDYHMRILGRDHVDQLRDEAARHRLARGGRGISTSETDDTSRRRASTRATARTALLRDTLAAMRRRIALR